MLHFKTIHTLTCTYIPDTIAIVRSIFQVNKELRSQKEHQELKLSLELEESNQLKVDYEQQLLKKQNEIHELEDMKNRLAAKEEIEERLVLEKEEAILQLNKVQHQLATLQSQVGGRGTVDAVAIDDPNNEGSSSETKEDLLLRELKRWTNQCQELKMRYSPLFMYTYLQQCTYVYRHLVEFCPREGKHVMPNL